MCVSAGPGTNSKLATGCFIGQSLALIIAHYAVTSVKPSQRTLFISVYVRSITFISRYVYIDYRTSRYNANRNISRQHCRKIQVEL